MTIELSAPVDKFYSYEGEPLPIKLTVAAPNIRTTSFRCNLLHAFHVVRDDFKMDVVKLNVVEMGE